MFKNKHFIIALVVAPILAVITYFGVDLAVSEKPHAAKKGESYKLISKSNCRYTSGLCDMENGEFKVQFRSESISNDNWNISLTSKYPLQGIVVSVVASQDAQGQPIDMSSTNADKTHWSAVVPAPISEDSLLRVGIQSEETLYYGDTTTQFARYETLFTDKTD